MPTHSVDWARRVATGLDDVAWPVVDVPFVAHVNPHLDEARAGASLWAKTLGLTVSPAAISRFERLDPAWLAANAYPTVGAAELDLAAAWVAWLFLFDDQGDEGAWGRDEGQWEPLMAPFHALLDGGSAAADGWPPLARALSDLLQRSCSGMTQSWSDRFRRHVRSYIDSYRLEAARRAQARPAALANYIVHRRDSGAMYIVFDLVEALTHAEIEPSVYDCREFQDLVMAASDVVCWDNDLASIGKELARGDVHNLVLVIQTAAECSLQEAIDRVAEMIRARIAAFTASRRLMDQLIDCSRLARVRQDQLGRCLDLYQHWMRANHDWPTHTHRYRDIVYTRLGATPDHIEPLLLPTRPASDTP